MSDTSSQKAKCDSSKCSQDDGQYRGNLAGFIVQALLAFLYVVVGLMMTSFMLKTGGEAPVGENKNAFFDVMFGTFMTQWGTSANCKAANVYLFVGSLCAFASVAYLVMAMVIKPLFWQCCSYMTNVPLWTSLAMTAFSWYFDPSPGNGIGWVWTVLLVLALGLEAMLVLIHFVDAKHAYVLPWIKSEAVPQLVI